MSVLKNGETNEENHDLNWRYEVECECFNYAIYLN